MLHHPTHDRLAELGLHGAAAAFADLIADPEAAELDHAAWLGLLLDRARRTLRGWTGVCKHGCVASGCAIPPAPEDIDYRTPRGLGPHPDRRPERPGPGSRTPVPPSSPARPASAKLDCLCPRTPRSPQRHRRHLSPRRPAVRGAGPRSWRRPSCPDAQQLGQDQAVHPRRLRPRTLSAQARHDLFEILEDRYGRTATIVVSQLPVERWHEMLGDLTIADAILDRLVHTAYRIELKGDSMRKLMAPKHGHGEALAPVGPQGILPRAAPPAP